MNNRFNFRVWDKGNKRYQGTQDWQPYLDTDGDVCFINTDDVRDYPPENYFIIEQCTGLSDKNGKLIYESDYVKANDIIYRVFWNKTKISLVNILNGDIIDISETITMEIVGNEHEKDNISEIPKNPKRSSD